ncbi:helix-turn-helix domain-containing protein [Pseudonocardia saturnea]
MSSAEPTPAEWAEVCLRILDAGAEGVDRVHTVLVAAASRFAGADGACVVAWTPDGPHPLAVSGGGVGAPVPLPARRPAPGVAAGSAETVASIEVDGEVDLHVRWSGPVQPGSDLLEQLRLLARLAATAVRQAGPQLASLYAVARQLLASRDREEVLLGLATATAEVLRAEIAGVFLATPDGAHLEARAVVGHRTVETARLRLARGKSMVGHVYATGEVYRSDDWTTDSVISKELLPIAAVEGTKACIGAPMRVDGAVVGVLAAWRRRRSVYTDDDVALIATLADLAALGVQRAVDDARLQDVSGQLVEANRELSARYEETRQALEIHRRLLRVVVDGAGLGSVVEALRAITGQEVVFDGDGGAVGWLGELLTSCDEVGAKVGEEAVLLGPDGAGRHAIGVTVRSAGQRWGRLAVATGLPVVTRDVLAVEQAAVACALLLSRQDASAGAMRRLESEFVWDLLDGRIPGPAEALVRSRQLARTLPDPARVIMLAADGTGSAAAPASSPERIEGSRTDLGRACARVLAAHGVPAQVGGRGDTLALVVPDRPLDVLRRLGRELCGLGGGLEIGGLSVGVSATVHGIGGYPAAGRQAAHARAAARPPDAPVAVFEDLGAVQFLLEPAHGEDLDRYAEQLLGPLLAYDRDHDAAMVETLEAYLRCDGQVGRAAESLRVHPKTMSYRLGRIEALTGMVVTRQEDRFNAQLALKILAIRAAGGG